MKGNTRPSRETAAEREVTLRRTVNRRNRVRNRIDGVRNPKKIARGGEGEGSLKPLLQKAR